MDAILQLRGVSKQFPGHAAVREVSLSVARGEFFSILGPSGCGKTTTLRMIAGFEIPSAGEVWLNGNRIDALPPYRRNVNTVFQSYALFPHLSVRGNVEFGLRRRNAERDRAEGFESDRTGPHGRERVARDFRALRRRASTRRTGPRAGARAGRAAARRTLSALDPQLRKQVRAELKDLQRRVGVTFVFVTHDQEEALSMSDRWRS